MAESNILSRVLWFDQKKGYGFLKKMSDKSEVFFHFSDIQTEGGFKKVFPGEYVNVDVENNEEGKLCGKNIRGVDGEKLLIDLDNIRFKYYNIRENSE